MNNKGEPQIENRGFNFDDACKYIGCVSRNTMSTLIAKGEIPFYMIGKRKYFTREHLDAFIDKLAEKAR